MNLAPVPPGNGRVSAHGRRGAAAGPVLSRPCRPGARLQPTFSATLFACVNSSR
jgi:hypothetical protein